MAALSSACLLILFLVFSPISVVLCERPFYTNASLYTSPDPISCQGSCSVCYPLFTWVNGVAVNSAMNSTSVTFQDLAYSPHGHEIPTFDVASSTTRFGVTPMNNMYVGIDDGDTSFQIVLRYKALPKCEQYLVGFNFTSYSGHLYADYDAHGVVTLYRDTGCQQAVFRTEHGVVVLDKIGGSIEPSFDESMFAAFVTAPISNIVATATSKDFGGIQMTLRRPKIPLVTTVQSCVAFADVSSSMTIIHEGGPTPVTGVKIDRVWRDERE